MNKKIFLILLMLFLAIGCTKNEKIESQKVYPLIEDESFKDIEINQLVSLKIVKYLESGMEEETIDDQETIINIFNRLTSIKIGSETNMSCDDNTTIYNFYTSDGKKYSIEFECEWLVLNNKRYNIE